MSFAYALTFFCDALLYFGAVGCLGLLGACRDDLFWVPVLLLGACWLSGRLGRYRDRSWLRWLPMAVAVPWFFAAGNWPGRLVSLPMLVYLPLYVYNNRRAPDYDYAADRFRHSLIGMGAALFFALILHSPHWKDGLPYLFLYFTLNMTLLRLLRHDDRVAKSRRFRALNLLGVGLVCAAGFALSQPAIVSALGVAWSWFVENVVLNLLALAAWAIQWVLYGFAWIFATVFGVRSLGPTELPDLNPMAGEHSMLPRSAVEAQALPWFVRLLIQGAGIALLAVVAFLILRALSRRIGRTEQSSGTDERESLDAEAPKEPRIPRLRRDPEAGVRHWYRKALMLIRARGGKVSPTMNTLQIQQQNAYAVNYEAMDALRETYLPVRYGGRAATRADVERARAAYERLKKS